MKISVITAVSNSAESIKSTVLSVVNQSYADYEHLIIDNLSNDETLSIIQKTYQESGSEKKLRIISEKDSGISDAFNKGIKHSLGDIIIILNSDDSFYSDLIFDDIVEIFSSMPAYFVHGDMFFVDPIYGTNRRKPLLCPVTDAMPLNHPGMFVRKSLYEQIGLYDTSYKFAMDYELVCRIAKLPGGLAQLGYYYPKGPIVRVHFGGASWKNEFASISEGKKALQKNDLWNQRAFIKYVFRMFRVVIKKMFTFFNLSSFVKIWRNFKWK
jgi:glycosyltransferase involved in cell wall biosynthesis